MEIWYTNTANLERVAMEALLEQLPEEMVQMVKSYRNMGQRLARVIARLIVRDYFIENGYEKNWCEWEKNPFEKPGVPNGPFFNISYSDDMIVVAFDNDSEIGVDIEKIKGTDVREISSFFHPDEISLLAESDYNIRLFYTIWTRKEALLKACGKGIAGGLHQVSILGTLINLDKTWYLCNVNISQDYHCALCCSNENPELLVRERVAFG